LWCGLNCFHILCLLTCYFYKLFLFRFLILPDAEPKAIQVIAVHLIHHANQRPLVGPQRKMSIFKTPLFGSRVICRWNSIRPDPFHP
jgi:hypothetical protein